MGNIEPLQVKREDAYKHILSVMKLKDVFIGAIKYYKVYTNNKSSMAQLYTFSKMADENTIDFTMANSDQIYFLQRWFN